MIQELIYTSAPKGLKPGSSGFCTVASTRGMALNLAQFLESLSGYRHLHSPGTPDARMNPVIHYFLRARIGGKQYLILSRISDAGLDYSGRSSKLAQHVVLDSGSGLAAGPAWQIQKGSLHAEAWDGEPRLVPPRNLNGGSLQPMRCATWQAITGDAGVAGKLLDSLVQRRPINIVCEPGADVLQLILEAQSLLPEGERWQATFATWFTKLPANAECLWRFLLPGSPEVALAHRSRDQTFLDLTKPVQADENSAATAARTGRPFHAASGGGGLARLLEEELPQDPVEELLPEEFLDDALPPSLPQGEEEVFLGPPTLNQTKPKRSAARFRTEKPRARKTLAYDEFDPPQRSWMPLIIVAMVVIVASLVGSVIWLANEFNRDPVADTGKPSGQNEEPQTVTDLEPITLPPDPKPEELETLPDPTLTNEQTEVAAPVPEPETPAQPETEVKTPKTDPFLVEPRVFTIELLDVLYKSMQIKRELLIQQDGAEYEPISLKLHFPNESQLKLDVKKSDSGDWEIIVKSAAGSLPIASLRQEGRSIVAVRHKQLPVTTDGLDDRFRNQLQEDRQLLAPLIEHSFLETTSSIGKRVVFLSADNEKQACQIPLQVNTYKPKWKTTGIRAISGVEYRVKNVASSGYDVSASSKAFWPATSTTASSGPDNPIQCTMMNPISSEFGPVRLNGKATESKGRFFLDFDPGPFLEIKTVQKPFEAEIQKLDKEIENCRMLLREQELAIATQLGKQPDPSHAATGAQTDPPQTTSTPKSDVQVFDDVSIEQAQKELTAEITRRETTLRRLASQIGEDYHEKLGQIRKRFDTAVGKLKTLDDDFAKLVKQAKVSVLKVEVVWSDDLGNSRAVHFENR